jgi:hypothetical protein
MVIILFKNIVLSLLPYFVLLKKPENEDIEDYCYIYCCCYVSGL